MKYNKPTPDTFYGLKNQPDLYKTMRSFLYQGARLHVDQLIQTAFEGTKKDALTLEEMANGIRAKLPYDLTPEQLQDWVYMYQERTGYDLLQELPGTNDKEY